MTPAPGQAVLVVDGYSTGRFYAPELRQRGLRPFHLASPGTGPDSYLVHALADVRDRQARDYEDFIDGTAPLEALLPRLAALGPAAVLAGCESGVEFADLLAARLGLPGNDPATSSVRRDKSAMHQALARAGLRCLRGLAADRLDDLQAFARDLGRWPLVVKPVNGAATQGVHFCADREELARAFEALLDSPALFGGTNRMVLAQECVFGRELAVNTVSREGRHLLSDLWAYTKIPGPGGVPLYDATTLVHRLGPEHRPVLDYAFAALDALGLRLGPAHLEIMVTTSGPVLIECGARPMGGAFPPDILIECLGHTQIQWSLDAHLDPEAFRADLGQAYRPRKHMMVKCLISRREGEVEAIPGITLLAGLASVRRGNFESCLSSGRVPLTVDLITAPAHLVLCHGDEEVLLADYALIRELEEEAQNHLFELAPAGEASVTPDWFRLVPDELWLKPEAEAAPDADLIWQGLEMVAEMEVLDCPCGDGRVGLHLARRGARLTGVDLNPRFVATARERFAAAGITAELLVMDMRDLPWEGRFDAVVNWFNSFGYFGIEDDFLALKRMTRALKPGGRILLEAPNRVNILSNVRNRAELDGQALTTRWDEISERVCVAVTVPDGQGTREIRTGARMYSPAQYKLLFRLAGLELVRIWGEGLTGYGEWSRRMILLGRKAGE